MEIAIGIIGLLIAWFTYQKTFLAKPKEEKEHLLSLFYATQKISKQVQEDLTQYAVQYNTLGIELYPGITYDIYISSMKDAYNTNLSDDLYNKIKNEKLTKSVISSMAKSLEKQLESLQLMQSEINMKVKQV